MTAGAARAPIASPVRRPDQDAADPARHRHRAGPARRDRAAVRRACPCPASRCSTSSRWSSAAASPWPCSSPSARGEGRADRPRRTPPAVALGMQVTLRRRQRRQRAAPRRAALHVTVHRCAAAARRRSRRSPARWPTQGANIDRIRRLVPLPGDHRRVRRLRRRRATSLRRELAARGSGAPAWTSRSRRPGWPGVGVAWSSWTSTPP